ncbi:cartilage intermediate layer protein 2-like [Amphiura filiformis]|uniref:cartilage intermediate layer protein 2-like n=1 Tax=Amphiura filiformis TaxID=82378 RepID=UPI003B21F81F
MAKPERRTSPLRAPSNVYTEERFGGPSTSDGGLYTNWEVGRETDVQPAYNHDNDASMGWGNDQEVDDGYHPNPRDSVTSETAIWNTSESKGLVGRRRLYLIIAVVVTLLILVAVAVALGVILSTSDHPCSACDCDTSILLGQITDNYDIPMSGATISYADQPNTTLAISDMTGRFRVIGVCATPQKLVVNNECFAAEEQMTTCSAYKEKNCTSYFKAQIRRMEQPFITENPRSKLRIEGQDVAFCCSAEGVPSPTNYEWLKDGDLIDNAPTNGDKLILKKLTEADSGIYACRVQNVAGNVLSDSAKLTVTATPVGCDPDPIAHTIQLPEDCIQPDTNRAEFDVGTCENKPCTGKIKDQTLCGDLESFCCREQERKTVNVNCQGYTLPVLKVTSCGCSKCEPKASQIFGRVVSADTLDNLDSIAVYYKSQSQNVTETDSTGRFLFSTEDAVSKVSLTFRDIIYKRVLDTTVVFQISADSARYDVIKMIPVNERTALDFDSQVDNVLPILNSHSDGSLGEITVAAHTVFRIENGEIYNGTVRVIVNNIDMRNREKATLAPGDSTALDSNGYKVYLRLFGVFSLRFTDPFGQPLYVAGQSQLRLTHPALLQHCENQVGDTCNIMLWVLNIKSGIWEKTSLLEVTNVGSLSRRKKRQDSVVVVGNLLLREYEWYSIADVDNKDRCWGKVIGYSDQYFNPNFVLPFIYQLTSVLVEKQKDQQGTVASISIYRISKPSSVTENGQVGVCVPLACPKDPSDTQMEAYLSATVDGEYMKPARPSDSGAYVSLTKEDRDRVQYFIANHDDLDTQPQILMRHPVADSMGPVYPGSEAGEVDGACSLAGIQNKHFQFHCPNCNDAICNTFHSVAKSPLDRQLQTFYPNRYFDKQAYCFIGVQIRTGSLSLRVAITSNSSEGLFYGRRELTLRKSNADDEFVNACMEFKCSGVVFDGLSSEPHDVTKVFVDINDKESTTCSVQAAAQDFSLGETQVPFTFDDPQTYGKQTGIHRDTLIRTESVCLNDEESPQTTNTEHCQIDNKFVYAALVTCS